MRYVITVSEEDSGELIAMWTTGASVEEIEIALEEIIHEDGKENDDASSS